jgi:hypothetical protein
LAAWTVSASACGARHQLRARRHGGAPRAPGAGDKLEVIAEEFGVDKASDVMDSVEAEPMFDELFVQGLQNPDAIEQECDAVVSQVRDNWSESKQEQRSAGQSPRSGRRRCPQVARPPGAVLAGARHHQRAWPRAAAAAP